MPLEGCITAAQGLVGLFRAPEATRAAADLKGFAHSAAAAQRFLSGACRRGSELELELERA